MRAADQRLRADALLDAYLSGKRGAPTPEAAPDLLAFHYGGTYICPVRSREAGKEIDEWRLLEAAPPSPFVSTSVPGPLLGRWDASSRAVVAIESRLAAAAGISAFVFNYYHNGQWSELDAPLQQFSSLETTHGVRFAINWCYRMPKRALPTQPTAPLCRYEHMILDVTEEERGIVVRLDENQTRGLVEGLAARFFGHPRYYRIDGACLLTLYHVGGLLRSYGVDGLEKLLRQCRAVARRSGFELHLMGLLSITNEAAECLEHVDALDFDSVSAYCCLPDFQVCEPVQDYDALVAKRTAEWLEVGGRFRHNFFPCVAAGWNATPRGASGYDPCKHGLLFPWAPVVAHNTPSGFGRYLTRAIEFTKRSLPKNRRLVMLGPWNEWTEGCYLLPDTEVGFARLEAIRAAMRGGT